LAKSNDSSGNAILGFAPVKPKRAFEEIVLQVQQAVIDGRIAPGERLPPERELAEIFGVSRPAVREAMRILEAFGIVSARRGNGPDSGSTISVADPRTGFGPLLRLYASLMHIPLSDLIEARVALETAAIRAAILTASDEDLGQLDEILASLSDDSDRDTWLERDTEFHLALAELSGNGALALLMGALREAIATQMLHAFHSRNDPAFARECRRLVRQHSDIIAAIRARNQKVATKKIEAHIRDFYTRVMHESGYDRPQQTRT